MIDCDMTRRLWYTKLIIYCIISYHTQDIKCAHQGSAANKTWKEFRVFRDRAEPLTLEVSNSSSTKESTRQDCFRQTRNPAPWYSILSSLCTYQMARHLSTFSSLSRSPTPKKALSGAFRRLLCYCFLTRQLPIDIYRILSSCTYGVRNYATSVISTRRHQIPL